MRVLFKVLFSVTHLVFVEALAWAAIFVYWLRADGVMIDGTQVNVRYYLYKAVVYYWSNGSVVDDHSLYTWSDKICASGAGSCFSSKQNYNASGTAIGFLVIIIAIQIVCFVLVWTNKKIKIPIIVLYSLELVITFVLLMEYGLAIDRWFYGLKLDWAAGWWIVLCLLGVVLWGSTVNLIFFSMNVWGRRVRRRD